MANKTGWQKVFIAGASDGMVAGMEYAGLVAVMVVAGYFLDRWLGTTPLFIIILSVFGFVGGFLRLFYASKYDEARRAFRGLPPKPQREVPDVLEWKEEENKRAESRELFDSKTGLTSFKDWNPRKYGEAIPPELEPDESSGESSSDGSTDSEPEEKGNR